MGGKSVYHKRNFSPKIDRPVVYGGIESLAGGIAFFVLVILFVSSFMLGRYPVSLRELYLVFLSRLTAQSCPEVPEMVQSVILKVRVPRICSAVFIGGALSVAGALYQGLFKNPMVSPDILGASAGAGFGAALAILLSFSFFAIQFTAFVFGLVAVMLSYLICKLVSRGKESLLVLILSGMVISTLFSSLVAFAKFVADPFKTLPEITYWLMGGLSSISVTSAAMTFPLIVVGMIPAMLLRWHINAMAFGDEEAQSMGLDTGRLRVVFIASATLLTTTCVAISGMIGWVGLVIPHLTRMLTGPNYKKLIPVSFTVGASFLLCVDNVARTMFSMELPLGILTSLVGAPFFVYLLFKRRRTG